MMIIILLLKVMIMIVQKDCIASSAQLNNSLAVDLMKICCIEHCTLLHYGYQNTNFQKNFRPSTPGLNRKLLSWAY